MNGYSILLVDDEESVRLSIALDLKAEGYQVEASASGAAALRMYKEKQFDLVITDLTMEGMDGVQLLKKIKEIKPEAIVMVLTGYGSVSTALEAMDAGAFEYVLKPCNRMELSTRVYRCLEKQELQKEVEEKSAELKATHEELKKSMERYKALEKSLQISREQLAKKNQKTYRPASLDELTGVANRKFFDEYLNREWRRAMRDSSTVSMTMIDLDYFKAYNESYGYLAGDDCLKKIAGVMHEIPKRPADLAARYDDEVFAVLFPDTDEKGAMVLAEKIRASVEALKIPHKHSPVVPYVTVSLGVFSCAVKPNSALPDFIGNLGRALADAKRGGRNQTKTTPCVFP